MQALPNQIMESGMFHFHWKVAELVLLLLLLRVCAFGEGWYIAFNV